MSVKSRIQMFQQAETSDSSSPFVVNSNNSHSHNIQQNGHKYSPKTNNLSHNSTCVNGASTINSNNSNKMYPQSNTAATASASQSQSPRNGLGLHLNNNNNNNNNCANTAPNNKSKSTIAINLSSSSTLTKGSSSSSSTTTFSVQRKCSIGSNPSVNSNSTPIRKDSVGSRSINGSGRVTPGSSSSTSSTPSPTVPSKPFIPGQKPLLRRTSSIPKLISPVSTHNPIVSSALSNSANTTMKQAATRKVSIGSAASVGGNKNGTNGISYSTSQNFNSSSSNNRHQLYDSISWKEKYEESEKRRLHVVTLAQKATRDYEELRRRYNEAYNEKEKLAQKLNNSNSQLESLRQASEATYELYYKLKKKYEVENSSKSEALVRVDQYNKENRRLKRQSQVLMQQINDSNIRLEDLIELSEVDSSDDSNDKEIVFLRNRVQELEAKLINAESELENTKLAEFETQESVMLMNDDAQTLKSENCTLRRRINDLENEKDKVTSELEQMKLELEMLRDREGLEKEKLHLAEAELRKIQAEKNVLQRQSHVLLSSNPLDTQLLETLNTLSELQFNLEEQRYNYESQLDYLKNQLKDKTLHYEAQTLQSDEKIKALEEQIASFQNKIEELENERDTFVKSAPTLAPPPPPPPMPCGLAPPAPPPLPLSGLSSSVQNVTLRRAKKPSSESCNSNGSNTPEKPSGLDASPQIDELVSQLKKGVKLKPMDRTMSRKNTADSPDSSYRTANGEDSAVEEMKSILNNLKRTRRVIL